MGDFLKKVLPWIGAAATGGVPALVGMAAKEISGAIGKDVDPKLEAIANAVTGATPEQLERMREREQEFQLRMQAMGFANAEELARIELAKDKLFAEDTDAARRAHAGDVGVFRLGIVVLVTFAVILVATLVGVYQILTDGIKVADVGTVAAVSGLVGSVVGYAAANAQQVIAYFFGSSRGSAQKTDSMAAAIAGVIQAKRA